jgi:hypothetical protein
MTNVFGAETVASPLSSAEPRPSAGESVESGVPSPRRSQDAESELVVQREKFVRAASQTTPTAALSIAIFFIQTFGLLAKEASFFGAAEVLNLDAEKAVGKCVTPLSYTQRYFAATLLTPVIMIAGVFACIPLWNFLRGRKLLRKLSGPR